MLAIAVGQDVLSVMRIGTADSKLALINARLRAHSFFTPEKEGRDDTGYRPFSRATCGCRRL